MKNERKVRISKPPFFNGPVPVARQPSLYKSLDFTLYIQGLKAEDLTFL